MPRVSIVIPARNEAENIGVLIDGILDACGNDDVEIIVVNDASSDDTEAVVRDKAARMPNLRLLTHAPGGGQSAAVHSGVRAATAAICATLDGDGQNPPAELPKLYAPLIAANAPADLGLVAGQRVGRQDTWSKKAASKAANWLRSKMLKDGTRDTGCGLKAFRRDAFLDLPYFDHMHRYLPALFARDGWKVAHVDVTHRARAGGTSNYTNIGRAMVGAADLIGVAWLLRRRKRTRPVEIVAERR